MSSATNSNRNDRRPGCDHSLPRNRSASGGSSICSSWRVHRRNRGLWRWRLLKPPVAHSGAPPNCAAVDRVTTRSYPERTGTGIFRFPGPRLDLTKCPAPRTGRRGRWSSAQRAPLSTFSAIPFHGDEYPASRVGGRICLPSRVPDGRRQAPGSWFLRRKGSLFHLLQPTSRSLPSECFRWGTWAKRTALTAIRSTAGGGIRLPAWVVEALAPFLIVPASPAHPYRPVGSMLSGRAWWPPASTVVCSRDSQATPVDDFRDEHPDLLGIRSPPSLLRRILGTGVEV